MSNEVNVRLNNLPEHTEVSTRSKRGYVPVSLGSGQVYIDSQVGVEYGVRELMRLQGEHFANGRKPFYRDGQLVTLEKGRNRGKSLMVIPVAGAHTETQIRRDLKQAFKNYRSGNQIR